MLQKSSSRQSCLLLACVLQGTWWFCYLVLKNNLALQADVSNCKHYINAYLVMKEWTGFISSAFIFKSAFFFFFVYLPVDKVDRLTNLTCQHINISNLLNPMLTESKAFKTGHLWSCLQHSPFFLDRKGASEIMKLNVEA